MFYYAIRQFHHNTDTKMKILPWIRFLISINRNFAAKYFVSTQGKMFVSKTVLTRNIYIIEITLALWVDALASDDNTAISNRLYLNLTYLFVPMPLFTSELFAYVRLCKIKALVINFGFYTYL